MMTASNNTENTQVSKSIIQTTRFGELEINADKIITLTSPFLGFPSSLQFVLIPHSEDSAFWWLQAVDNPDLAFVVIRPSIITPHYQPEIPLTLFQELQAENHEEVELLAILTIPQGNPKAMTANLLGPVALNATKLLAKQILLDPNQYSACWPVFQQD